LISWTALPLAGSFGRRWAEEEGWMEGMTVVGVDLAMSVFGATGLMPPAKWLSTSG
jgi:hypothetical protein